jgi:hypothetical protein
MIQCNICDEHVDGCDGVWIWGAKSEGGGGLDDPWTPTLFLCAGCFLSNRDSLCQCSTCQEEAREFEAAGYYRGP